MLAPVAESQGYALDLVAVLARVTLRILRVSPQVFFAFKIHIQSHVSYSFAECQRTEVDEFRDDGFVLVRDLEDAAGDGVAPVGVDAVVFHVQISSFVCAVALNVGVDRTGRRSREVTRPTRNLGAGWPFTSWRARSESHDC